MPKSSKDNKVRMNSHAVAYLQDRVINDISIIIGFITILEGEVGSNEMTEIIKERSLKVCSTINDLGRFTKK